jgi:hypothetical protein
MRLVTYDRRGHRRLGAILGGEVVDLPDVVGHPAFPTTLEALVASSGGTVMDAARAALERHDEAERAVVKQARILPPLFPTSMLMPGASGVERRIVGPEQPVPWPEGAAWVDYEPKVAAVLGRETTNASIDDVRPNVFGYTLVNDWSAHDASGDPLASAKWLPLAIGPSVVTADELDPQAMVMQVKVDGEEIGKGNLNGVAESLHRLISDASGIASLGRGDAFALGPFGGADLDPARRLWPGALIELSAEGIGTLRNRLAPRS